ncbi:MAG: bifunctional folylpolyglutamate synthase/dihydrofolate synthase [Rickettsiales bacterium TMED289]|nr:MAG: bifunctional folylpolyglutamate synthase/dihydrofolate synthase [Rickettsiales bacterium TMED289]|tara:strand:- start:860 stop:2125 length:1266 start_codon:yes stop_codon:yes gene_type:complete
MKLQNLALKLEKHHKKKIDLSLDRTFNLLKKLGNPHHKLKNVVNVVGTNAKASMAYSFKSILNKAGYKCNLYTSPHLISYTERFIFNDEEISEEKLVELLNYVERILGDDQATLFEILTCAFYKYAENFKDNVNIIESGLFYRMDPSSVFEKNILTLLGVCHADHYKWLKNQSIDGVIYEKTSKLLNSNIFVNKQVNEEIRKKIEVSLERNTSNKYYFGKNFHVSRSEKGLIIYKDDLGELILPEPNILGDHQLHNISTSIAACRKIFQVRDEDIKKGIQNISLKGRLQEIKKGKLKDIAGNNRLIIDGGHNVSSSYVIANWIKNQKEDINLIVAMMEDKDHFEFMKSFKGIVNSVTVIDIPGEEGAISKNNLRDKIKNLNFNLKISNNIEEAIKLNSKNENQILLCVGSLYLTGKILNLN